MSIMFRFTILIAVLTTCLLVAYRPPRTLPDATTICVQNVPWQSIYELRVVVYGYNYWNNDDPVNDDLSTTYLGSIIYFPLNNKYYHDEEDPDYDALVYVYQKESSQSSWDLLGQFYASDDIASAIDVSHFLTMLTVDYNDLNPPPSPE